MAHTYYKEGDFFVNLGVKSGCITNGQYRIKETLESLPDIHRTPESIKKDVKDKLEKINTTCQKENENTNEFQTTADMARTAILTNDCLEKAIKQEIDEAFEAEDREEMYQLAKDIRKNTLKFYANTYQANIYCKGYCGTISALIPYADEEEILIQMLEQLIYTNINRGGY